MLRFKYFFGLDAFYQAKKVLNAPNGGYGGLIALFWAADEGRPSETLKVGFSDGLPAPFIGIPMLGLMVVYLR